MPALLEKLIKADAIPSPPGVALEVVRLNQDEDVDIARLAAVVERDPAIVAKLLKMANSAAFGRPGQIADIHQAIVALGLRSVNMLALSFSVVSTSSGESRVGFDYKDFWTSTAVTATAARALAQRYLPGVRDEAFLAGLLCDFAQLVLAECAPEEYAPVLEARRRGDEPLQQLERRLIETDHALLGGELLASWGIPPLVTRAIGAHHDPERLDEEDAEARDLARLLCMAGICGELYKRGDVEGDIKRLAAAGERYFEMDLDACRELLEQIESATPEMLDMLDFEPIDPAELAEIRIQATEHLVKESLALNQRMNAVSSDVEKLQHEKSELEQKATTDPLTGLRNRGFFDEALVGELERAAQAHHSLGLLILDIDHFKAVNDTYGHRCGDAMLKAVAQAISSHVGDSESVCRYGGEEIAVLCPGVDRAGLEERAETLRCAVARVRVDADGEPVGRTISVGGCLAAHPTSGELGAALVEAADAELYRAKSNGRNRCFTTQL